MFCSKMLEEEINMLFNLSMPEDWRNRMPSTPPASPSASKMEEDVDTTCSPSSSSGKPNFWAEVGLRSYAQMDFDLELSLNQKCRYALCPKKGGRRRKVSSPTPLGGLMYHPDNTHTSTVNKHLNFSSEPVADNSENKEDLENDSESDDEFSEIVPPNALGLINILRLTIDCPFSDIRKQAANVLFLLKEKGVPIPYALIDGPCTFIHPSECPSIDVDRFANELGFEDAVGGSVDEVETANSFYEENTEDHLEFQKFVDEVMQMFNRQREYESDSFATKLGYGDDLIDAIIELNKENLGYPYYDKWYWYFHSPMPSLLQRIEEIEEEMRRMQWKRLNN